MMSAQNHNPEFSQPSFFCVSSATGTRSVRGQNFSMQAKNPSCCLWFTPAAPFASKQHGTTPGNLQIRFPSQKWAPAI